MSAARHSVDLALAAAEAAADKLARDVVVLDVSEQLVITDCFVLAAADNERQVRSLVDAVEERLATMGAKPARREGQQDHRWVLLDYVDVVVHVQHVEERTYYALERLWKDCPRIPLPAASAAGSSHPAR